jgi:hypothetical protein
MEGTGSFGAGLRFLADYGLSVIEVDRPDRADRRRNGKSDPLDLSPPPGLSSPDGPPARPSPATPRSR